MYMFTGGRGKRHIYETINIFNQCFAIFIKCIIWFEFCIFKILFPLCGFKICPFTVWQRHRNVHMEVLNRYYNKYYNDFNNNKLNENRVSEGFRTGGDHCDMAKRELYLVCSALYCRHVFWDETRQSL